MSQCCGIKLAGKLRNGPLTCSLLLAVLQRSLLSRQHMTSQCEQSRQNFGKGPTFAAGMLSSESLWHRRRITVGRLR